MHIYTSYYCIIRYVSYISLLIDSVGVELPTVEVRAEDVEVEAEAYARGQEQAAAPNIFNSITNTALVLHTYFC